MAIGLRSVVLGNNAVNDDFNRGHVDAATFAIKEDVAFEVKHHFWKF